jgi:predicted metal-dependent phosphoesterase TrpH
MPRPPSGHVDLHAHSTASDGSYAPKELVAAAVAINLDALAITDHDTFSGYEAALPSALECSLTLVRGIELNSRLALEGGRHRYIHVLGYWPWGEPAAAFLVWLQSQQADRRERNRRLIESLANRGVQINLEEVESVGRSLTGRPHFARVLVEKGYASDSDDAFRRYLGESAPSYVERQSLSTAEVIRMIRQGGGAPVIAHPIRINLPHGDFERRALAALKNDGLVGLEVRHSEHPPELQRYYAQLAKELGLLPTGGSDFHGTIKPDIHLGSGRDGNVRVPTKFWEDLRLTLSHEPKFVD